MSLTKLSEMDYAIRQTRRELPENTIVVEDDGQIARLSWYDDAIRVRFLDLTDGWRWDAVVGRMPMDARQFIDNWYFVVEQWHRMMLEKDAP